VHLKVKGASEFKAGMSDRHTKDLAIRLCVLAVRSAPERWGISVASLDGVSLDATLMTEV